MTADLALVWPELILTIGGLITLMLGTFLGDRQVGLYQLAAMLTLAAAAAAVLALFGVDTTVFSGTLAVDSFGGLAKLIIYAWVNDERTLRQSGGKNDPYEVFRKMLKDEPLLSPEKIGTDGANTFPSTIKTFVEHGLLRPDPVHYVTKHLQQGIESDHFRVKKNMPKIGGFQSFKTARRTIAGFEAMLWLRKGFGFTGDWTVNDQNDLLARLFGLQKVNKA